MWGGTKKNRRGCAGLPDGVALRRAAGAARACLRRRVAATRAAAALAVATRAAVTAAARLAAPAAAIAAAVAAASAAMTAARLAAETTTAVTAARTAAVAGAPVARGCLARLEAFDHVDRQRRAHEALDALERALFGVVHEAHRGTRTAGAAR